MPLHFSFFIIEAARDQDMRSEADPAGGQASKRDAMPACQHHAVPLALAGHCCCIDHGAVDSSLLSLSPDLLALLLRS